ncbi:MAG: hypothetical protein NVS3B24_21320 [Candidatus Dormibacteria bacterium]
MSSSPRFEESAQRYATSGWAVLPLHGIIDNACTCGRTPCSSAGKHPSTPHGVKDASTDATKIAEWWLHRPDSNIGIATGHKSDLLVLDVDGDAGMASLLQLEEEYGPLPPTRVVKTGRGRHHYFTLGGALVGCPTGIRPGLDLRGEGGYVVAPPSRHHSGLEYDWLMLKDLPLPLVPSWLLEMAPKQAEYGITTASDEAAPDDAPENFATYADAMLARGCKTVLHAKPGVRNSTLNKIAFGLGQLVMQGALPDGLVRQRLRAAAVSAGLEHDEIAKTIESGLEAGKREQPHFRRTDIGNGERLRAIHGDELRYHGQRGAWLTWTGQRWEFDETGAVIRHAKHVVQTIYAEAARAPHEQAAALARHATSSSSMPRLKAMIEAAASEPGMTVLAGDLDTDDWSLNVANGTLDLRTGDLRRANPADLITRLAPVAFDRRAKAPTWDKFLDTITDGDVELQAYLQRAVGYSMTGSTVEQKVFTMHGIGANGKSTFLEAIRAVMGDYTKAAAFSTFMVQRSENTRNDLAAILGARLVTAVEGAQGKKLDEAVVKQMTGGDPITARFLFKEHFEATPTFKVWLATNHRPQIVGTDEAIWRRMVVIPFAVSIPQDKQDRHLKDRLKAEASGILNWALEGGRDYQAFGLQPPRAVVLASRDYRSDMDTLAAFIQESLVRAVGGRVNSSQLYAKYQAWCFAYGEKPLMQRALGLELKARGFTSVHLNTGNSWVDWAIRPEAPGAPPDF